MAGMLLLVRYAIFLPLFNYYNLNGLMPGWQFWLLVAATVLIGAGGYVINDVLDIDLDRINKPDRQIIGKKLNLANGNNFHMGLSIAGVIIGLVFSYLIGKLYLGVLFIIVPTALFYYSYKYKYLPLAGNLTVALLAALNVIIYWLFEFYNLKKQAPFFVEASLYFPLINRFVFSFAFFAFMTILVREIIKDAEDIIGDQRFGCKTIPVIIGIGATKWLLFSLELVILGTLVVFQIYLMQAGYTGIVYFLGITLILLVLMIYKTLRAKEKIDFNRLSLIMKIVMVSGMVSLAAIWLRNI
jgi:4-hydroxybenzoate polyprenyltransferase